MKHKNKFYICKLVPDVVEFSWLGFGTCSETVSWREVYLVHQCPAMISCNLKSRHGGLSFTDPPSSSVLHTTAVVQNLLAAVWILRSF